MTENSLYPYLHLGAETWENAILEKIDEIYSVFIKQPEQELPYFALMDTFLSIMKLLYEHLDVTTHDTTKESHELVSLRNMITYIEEHLTQRIVLDDIAVNISPQKPWD